MFKNEQKMPLSDSFWTIWRYTAFFIFLAASFLFQAEKMMNRVKNRPLTVSFHPFFLELLCKSIVFF